MITSFRGAYPGNFYCRHSSCGSSRNGIIYLAKGGIKGRFMKSAFQFGITRITYVLVCTYHK